MAAKKFYIKYFMLLMPGTLLACLAYYSAWSYFWSGFKWSPFGYEECGLESLAWPFFIFPALGLSFLSKAALVKFFGYPKILWQFHLSTVVLTSLYVFDKGFGQGLMEALFIMLEIAVAVITSFCANNSAKQAAP